MRAQLLLAVLERRPDPLQLGRVMADAADALNTTARIAHRKVGVAQPADLAVHVAPDAILEGDMRARAHPVDAGQCPLAVLVHDECRPASVIVTGQSVLAAYTVDRLEGRGQILPLKRLGVPDPRDVGGRLSELPEALLALSQPPISLLASGQIGGGPG